MEAAHQESIQMSKIFHLREAAAGDNGGRFGDHMGTHPPEGPKRLDQIGTHDYCVQGTWQESWDV